MYWPTVSKGYLHFQHRTETASKLISKLSFIVVGVFFSEENLQSSPSSLLHHAHQYFRFSSIIPRNSRLYHPMIFQPTFKLSSAGEIIFGEMRCEEIDAVSYPQRRRWKSSHSLPHAYTLSPPSSIFHYGGNKSFRIVAVVMSHSQTDCVICPNASQDVHGLVLEISIRLLAGSTR